MANILRHEMYVKSNVADNNNKFWEIKLMDDFSVHVKNGRVGSSGQVQPVKNFSNKESAELFFDKKIKEKASDRKGYVRFKGLLDSGITESSTVTVNSSNLEDIAVKEIESSSSETVNLIKYLSKRNIHNITSATTMTYDTTQGTFKTPLGIVTQEGIDEARVLLNELVPYVEKQQYSNNQFIDKLQQYIQLIPRKVGRKLLAEELFPNTSVFQQEGQILDALDASLQSVLSGTKYPVSDKPRSKLFNVKIELLNNQKEFDRIDRLYRSTKLKMHTSFNLKIKTIYTVQIEHMKNAYEKKSKIITTNNWELWHGSRVENVLSILKGGLIIPKSSAAHVTGRLYGDGIYGSDMSTKALNYAQGYWGHGKKDNNCYMFLVNFLMGKYFTPSGRYHSYPNAGYDSTFAKAGQSGVLNNEMIIYSLDQCNINYLVEFTD